MDNRTFKLQAPTTEKQEQTFFICYVYIKMPALN